MKIKILLLIFILINLFHYKTVAQVTCNANRAQDSTTLRRLYTSTNGAAWTTKWDTTKSMNTWFGVTLNTGGRVIKLEMSNNNLTGTLPNELNSLCALQTLDLSNNKISGTLPPQMSIMSGLLIVKLNSNQLTGQIPRIRAFSLTNLDFGNNQFSGTFPDLDTCFSLKSLELRFNKISGTIPLSFYISHYPLQYLSAPNNQLTGSILSQISNLSSLQTLNLDNNQFLLE